MLAVNLIITNIRIYFSYILQITARIKEYCNIQIVERLLYIVIAFILLREINSYEALLIADNIAKLLSLFLAIYYCKEIVLNKNNSFCLTNDLKEIKANVSAGSKLMLSNIVGYFIIGIVRIGIDKKWNIETFGQISLTLTFSSLCISVINSIGIVIFPMLKHLSDTELSNTYNNVHKALDIIIFSGMVFFHPIQILLYKWLPQYAESIKYMSVLLPVLYFECNMSLLNNTCMKALRKEKEILIINIFIVMISLCLTMTSIYFTHNLTLMVYLILMLYIFRTIFFEMYLYKVLHINRYKDLSKEILISILFVICNFYLNGMLGFLIFLICVLVFLIQNKKYICNIYKIVTN